MDERKALAENYTLCTKNDKNKYVIKSEIGRGSSCIVYDAFYRDDIGAVHNIRLKECYPYIIKLHRYEDNINTANEAEEEKFNLYKEQFKTTYKINTEIQNKSGLINSTVNSSDIFFANNTVYAAEQLNEGKDYGKIDFEPIHETLIRIRTLSLIIQNYHKQGYLHLDIKPENILILPETKEQMILFDFDSIVKIDNIKQNKDVRLSYSEGYGAPELKQGRLSKIGFAADIYEIGALTYFKLFGKTPGLNERKQNAKYDFEELKLKSSKYQPKLYRKLENFFHKTLSSAVNLRWQSMAEVIEALDELISLSDLSKTFLYDNFIYNTDTFIGREEELCELEEGLEENHAVFLHGIGGIGKSEIAKRFLKNNRKSFGTILVLNFKGSLKDTILSQDVELGNFSREENEEQEDFYKRKLRALKQELKKDDIILLDNFDTERDDELESLFDCKCKFIVTSREDYSDFNYFQIEINEMASDEDLRDLFYSYNQTEYSREEQAAVKDIINFVDRHTMTVELIAKHLRISESSPLEVLEEIKSLEGITELDDTNVKHRKDRRLRAETVEKHLLTLFNLSCFEAGEQAVIKSLSLLGYVRVSRDQFSKWCKLEPSDGSVEKLVDRGWIKYEEGKIYLHQIILDLVYNHLNPTSESCPGITEFMTEYASEDIQSYTNMRIRNDLIENFIYRIKGDDLRLAKLYYEYCSNVNAKCDIAEKMTALYEKNAGNKPEILMKAHKTAAVSYCKDIDIMECYEDYDVQMNIADNIIRHSETAVKYAEEYYDNKEKTGDFIYELGQDLKFDTDSLYFDFMPDDSRCEVIDKLYEFIIKLYEKAEKYYTGENGVDNEKICSLYSSFLEIYSPGMFDMYLAGFMRDTEKINHYKEKLAEYSSENSFYMGTGYDEIAEKLEDINPESAVNFYLKAIENEEGAVFIIEKLARAYLNSGDPEGCYNAVMTYIDDYNERTTVLYDLLDFCIEKEDYDFASEICNDAVNVIYNRLYVEKDEYISDENVDLSYLLNLRAYKQKILLCLGYLDSCSDDEWKEAVRLYSENKENLNNLHMFYYVYAHCLIKNDETEKGLSYLLKYLKYISQIYKPSLKKMEDVLKIITKITETDCKYINFLAEAYIMVGEADTDLSDEMRDYKMKKLVYAKELADKYENIDYSVKMKAYGKTAHQYMLMGLDDEFFETADKCDFYAAAEADDNQASDKWKDAAEAYGYMGKYSEAEKCYNRMTEAYLAILKKNEEEPENREILSYHSFITDYIDRIMNAIKGGMYEHSYNLAFNLVDEALTEHFERNKNHEEWDITDDLDNVFNSLSECMVNMGKAEEAVLFRALSTAAELKYKYTKEFFAEEVKKCTKNFDCVIDLITEILSVEVNEDNIDFLINLCEDILDMELAGDILKKSKTICSNFIGQHKTHNIEFKQK
ncbi:MAG: hypothetical protein LUC92_09720 [Clostridiales bacterium]|nr:hypothetical protein [Clostridiales bacterium]